MLLNHSDAIRSSSRAQPCQHSGAQQFVLLTTPAGRARRAFDTATGEHDLLRAELVSGQIDLDSGPEPIPPVIPDSLTLDMNVGTDQLPAEQIMQNQSRHTALLTRRIAGMPDAPRGQSILHWDAARERIRLPAPARRLL
jgi:hypothetical protein